MNDRGHTATLVASHPGNANAERTGVFSRSDRPLEPQVVEMAGEIMALEHTSELDEIGAIEIAKLVRLIDRIDDELAERGLTRKNGEPRALLDHRGRYSRRLAEWLDRYGITPKGRADFAHRMATGGLAARDSDAEEVRWLTTGRPSWRASRSATRKSRPPTG